MCCLCVLHALPVSDLLLRPLYPFLYHRLLCVGNCSRLLCCLFTHVLAAAFSVFVQSSLPSCYGGGTTSSSSANGRHHHQQAWQLFAPKTPSPSKRAALALDLKRRARLRSRVTGAGGAGSAVSPAQMYRVTRGTSIGGAQRQQQQQQQRFAPNDREGGEDAGGIEVLQSPRSAELLTVYSSSSSMSSPATSQQLPSIAEDIGGGVVSQGEGESARPALPLLSEEDLTQLRAGQRVQKQKREGGSGSGSVVVDVRADPDVVLGLLTKYEDYADMIDTVRQCEVFPQGETAEDTRKVRTGWRLRCSSMDMTIRGSTEGQCCLLVVYLSYFICVSRNRACCPVHVAGNAAARGCDSSSWALLHDMLMVTVMRVWRRSVCVSGV